MGRRTVAVIGGGCAGVLATRELLRCTGDEVVLIEPREPGGGVAYGTAQAHHMLNSRAGVMSADPDDPDHFVRWADARGIPAMGDDFLSRRDYGRYLGELLAAAAASHPGRLRILRACATAVRADASGCAISLSTMDDRVVGADHVVLAVGSPASAQPAVAGDHPGYVADPWRASALDAVPGDAPVLLIGTGLTAVDVALSLTAVDRSAPVTAVSRRGLLPLSHTRAAAPSAPTALGHCRSLRDVVRAVRASAGTSDDWRATVDGLRPRLDQLWSAFTPTEQEAFLRHLARPWECHRHRMAPVVAARIAALRACGMLRVRSGGLRSIAPVPAGGLLVEPEPADAAERFAVVVNCAGPGRLPAAAPAVVRDLLDAGLARVGPHRLGLDVDPAGRLIATDGAVQPRLWVLGPLRRGRLWETTAVPEIRAQARRLAADLREPQAVQTPAAIRNRLTGRVVGHFVTVGR
jgi:uncharacterized NAD(P)/FAD-binding protein YdhS